MFPVQDTPPPWGRGHGRRSPARLLPAANPHSPSRRARFYLRKTNSDSRSHLLPGTRRLCEGSRHLSGRRAATLPPRARRECCILKSVLHTGQVPTATHGRPRTPVPTLGPSPHVPPPPHLHLMSPPDPHSPVHPKRPQVGDAEHRRLAFPLSPAPQAGRPPRRTVGSHALLGTPQGTACWFRVRQSVTVTNSSTNRTPGPVPVPLTVALQAGLPQLYRWGN